MASNNSIQLSNASASSSGVALASGRYGFSAHATWGGGTVKVQILALDGATWIDAGSAVSFTADGYGTIDLPACTARISVATATAVYAALSRIGNLA